MNVKDFHREAMKFNDLAIIARKEDPDAVKELYIKAFKLEKQAYMLFSRASNEEPTRSILLRSAANLAMLGGQQREAEKMIALGLAGDPPEQLADEFRDVLQQVNFHRHLETKGIELQAHELQFSLSGDAVGHGIVRSEEFLSRIEVLEKLAHRTADRLRNVPYKEQGRRKKSDVLELEPYLSVPRAASFAITMRFGRPSRQVQMPGLESQLYIIDDILNNIELIQNNEIEQLNQKIPDEIYRRNFIALTKKLSPDGDKVKLVGFTVKRNNYTRTVPLTKITTSFKTIESEPEVVKERKRKVEIEGVLFYADSKSQKIKLKAKDGTEYDIVVPEGLMSDVVKPHWEDTIIVTGNQTGSTIELLDIDSA